MLLLLLARSCCWRGNSDYVVNANVCHSCFAFGAIAGRKGLVRARRVGQDWRRMEVRAGGVSCERHRVRATNLTLPVSYATLNPDTPRVQFLATNTFLSIRLGDATRGSRCRRVVSLSLSFFIAIAVKKKHQDTRAASTRERRRHLHWSEIFQE